MKKFLTVILSLIALGILLIAIFFATFKLITKDDILDADKLTNYSQSIVVCDGTGEQITNASLSAKTKSVNLNDLNDNTVNAFIASEDRTFYKHGGLNYKRMAKALYKNILSRSFKEGASTISQQLIKNTHLSGEKTIKRKLSEIKLTKELEKNYSKDEILEMYLNTIYFGHNCYGLESAAEFYFGETAAELSLEQAATMAGLLSSPNNYSPFKNAEKCLTRRNLVLKCMSECGFITDNEYLTAKASPLTAQKNSNGAYNDYLNAVFDELEELDLDYYTLSEGCKIETYLDQNLQKTIENIQCEHDNAMIVTSVSGGVKAFKSTIGNAKRQPGSTIKPLLVYAPAIEEKILLPDTKITDEYINYSGYSPENYDKKYHGNVTVKESISKSYNIPAVKTLNTLTLDKAEKYADKLNLTFDKDDKNLSLALGGMKYGYTLKDLCDGYATFSSEGMYKSSHFIKEITLKNGKSIYKAENISHKVFSEGTCSVVNEMLMETTKTGTAKKLKDLPYDVAAKTGTCGDKNGNTDAYCICYTSGDCIGVWLGDKNNQPHQITGGADCTKITKEILLKMYETDTPAALETNKGTSIVKIDRGEYNKNNKIILADDASPKLNIKEIKVPSGSEPVFKSTYFSQPKIEKPTIKVENNTIFISLCQTEYYAYMVERQNNGQKTVIYDGDWQQEITDVAQEGNSIYTVTPYYFDGYNYYYGTPVVLPEVNTAEKKLKPQTDMPDITRRNWYEE